MTRATASLLVGIALAGSVAFAPPASAAERELPTLYRWVDSDGIVRYTPDKGRIPLRRRGSAEVVSADMPNLPADSYHHETEPGPRWTSPIGETVVPGGSPTAGGQPAAAGSAGTPSPAPPTESAGTPAAAAAGDLDAQISSLEAEIDRDEEALKAMISRDPTDGVPTLVSDPELREIARRIPELQSRLEALREERERQPGR